MSCIALVPSKMFIDLFRPPSYKLLQARAQFYWPGPSDRWLMSKTVDVHLRLGSKRHRHLIGFFKVPFQHRQQAILSVLPRLDPSMAQLYLNSQPKDDSYAISIDNGQIHYASGVKTPLPPFTTCIGTQRIYCFKPAGSPWATCW